MSLTLVYSLVVPFFQNLPEDEGHARTGAVRPGVDFLQQLHRRPHVPTEKGGGGESDGRQTESERNLARGRKFCLNPPVFLWWIYTV